MSTTESGRRWAARPEPARLVFSAMPRLAEADRTYRRQPTARPRPRGHASAAPSAGGLATTRADRCGGRHRGPAPQAVRRRGRGADAATGICPARRRRPPAQRRRRPLDPVPTTITITPVATATAFPPHRHLANNAHGHTVRGTFPTTTQSRGQASSDEPTDRIHPAHSHAKTTDSSTTNWERFPWSAPLSLAVLPPPSVWTCAFTEITQLTGLIELRLGPRWPVKVRFEPAH